MKVRVSLFSNNEPLLDHASLILRKIPKQEIPKAHLFLMTNGKLLTPELFDVCMKSLDGLVIDNYDNQMKLQEPVKAIAELCLTNPTYEEKSQDLDEKEGPATEYQGRKRTKQNQHRTAEDVLCSEPFTRMVVRPDGKISLCCFDALGKVTLGDLTRDSISEVWNSDLCWSVRLKNCRRAEKLFFVPQL